MEDHRGRNQKVERIAYVSRDIQERLGRARFVDGFESGDADYRRGCEPDHEENGLPLRCEVERKQPGYQPGEDEEILAHVCPAGEEEFLLVRKKRDRA